MVTQPVKLMFAISLTKNSGPWEGFFIFAHPLLLSCKSNRLLSRIASV